MKVINKLSQSIILVSILILSLIGCNPERQNTPNDIKSLGEYSNYIQGDISFDTDSFKLKRKYNALIAPYLILDKNGLYSLDIKEEDYSKTGVPKEVIIEMKREIEKTNKIIEQYKKEGVFIETPDPKNLDVIKEASKLRVFFDGDMNNPISGDLRTNGQERVTSGYIWVPVEYKSVSFSCQSSVALTPIFICGAYTSGQWVHNRRVGVFGYASMNIGLYTSNDKINLSFQTSDSNGGSAVYYGMKR